MSDSRFYGRCNNVNRHDKSDKTIKLVIACISMIYNNYQFISFVMCKKWAYAYILTVKLQSKPSLNNSCSVIPNALATFIRLLKRRSCPFSYLPNWALEKLCS